MTSEIRIIPDHRFTKVVWDGHRTLFGMKYVMRGFPRCVVQRERGKKTWKAETMFSISYNHPALHSALNWAELNQQLQE